MIAMEAQVRATYNFTHGPVCEDLTRRTEIHGRLCARYDRVKTVTPMSRKRVVLVSQQEPVLNGNVVDYGADLSTWKGRATLVLPTDAVITKEPVYAGVDQTLSCWKVFAESLVDSNADNWLVIYQLCPKSEEFPALNPVVNVDGSITTTVATIQPPGPTVPNPLPPIKSDGGGAAPPSGPPPIPREGGSMQANFATVDADHVSVLISGLPAGITIKSAHAQGIEDGRWTYSFPSPPDAPIVVNGMTLTWEKNVGGQANPNTDYIVSVLGSDDKSETATTGGATPAPGPTPQPTSSGSITVTVSGSGATVPEALAAIKAALP